MRIYFEHNWDSDEFRLSDDPDDAEGRPSQCIDVDPSLWARFAAARAKYFELYGDLDPLARAKEKENEAAEEKKGNPTPPWGPAAMTCAYNPASIIHIDRHIDRDRAQVQDKPE